MIYTVSTHAHTHTHLDAYTDEELHQLERNYVLVQREKNAADEKVDQLSSSLQAAESSLATLKTAHEAKVEECSQTKHLLSESGRDLVAAQADKRRFLEVNSKLQQQLDQQIKQSEQYSSKVLVLSSELSSLETKFSSASSELLPVQFERDQLQQSKELLEKENKWLKEELRQKAEELLRVRKDKSHATLELESQLIASQEEAKALSKALESAKQRIEQETQTNAASAERIRLMGQEHVTRSESLQQELATQTKLSELYQRAAEEHKAKLLEVRDSNEALTESMALESRQHSQARDAADITLEKLEEELKRAQASLQESREEAEKLTRALEEERSKNQSQLSQLTQLTQANLSSHLLPAADDDSICTIQSSSSAIAIAQSTHLPMSMRIEGAEEAEEGKGQGHAALYAKFVTVTEQLRKALKENRQMEGYIKQIQREVSEKAPLIQSQRYQYNMMLKSHQKLSDKLTEATRANAELEREHQRLTGGNKELGSELDKQRQEADDLARQVRSLLKSQVAHTHRGSVASPAAASLSASSGALAMSADEVISDRLVVLNSIDDMQEQNRRLRTVARELGKENEKFVKEQHGVDQLVEEKVTAAVKEKLLDAHSVIDDLKRERSAMELRMEALVTRLQMHINMDEEDKDALVNASNTGSSGTTTNHKNNNNNNENNNEKEVVVFSGHAAKRVSGSGSESESEAEGEGEGEAESGDDESEKIQLQELIDALQRQLKEQEKALSDSKKHLSEYRREKMEVEAMLQRSLETVRREASEARIAAAKGSSEAAFLKSSYELLQRSFDGQKSELAILRTKNSEFSGTVTKQQASLQEYRLDLNRSEDEQRKMRVELETSRGEAALLRQAQERLLKENSMFNEQKIRQDKVLESLNSMQSSMQEREMSERKQLIQEKEEMRSEWVTAAKQLEEERRSNLQMSSMHASQITELRAKVDEAKARAQQQREAVVRLEAAETHWKASIQSLESQVQSKDDQVNTLLAQKTAAASPVDLSDSKFSALGKQQQLELEIKVMKKESEQQAEELEEARGQLEALKTIATATEQELEALIKSSQAYQSKAEGELREARQEKDTLKQRVQELRAACQESDKENNELRRRTEAHSKQQQQALAQGEQEKAALQGEVRALETRAQGLQADIKRHADMAQESQSRYERELVEHAKDIQVGLLGY